MSRNIITKAEPKYSEVAIIIVQNSKKEFLVHQRSNSKRVSPDKYGLGAGGRVDPEENPETAAQRELYEELCIKPKLKFLVKILHRSSLRYRPVASGLSVVG